ncbi:hypothetical protein D3C77_520550 [compost metagenome]
MIRADLLAEQRLQNRAVDKVDGRNGKRGQHNRNRQLEDFHINFGKGQPIGIVFSLLQTVRSILPLRFGIEIQHDDERGHPAKHSSKCSRRGNFLAFGIHMVQHKGQRDSGADTHDLFNNLGDAARDHDVAALKITAHNSDQRKDEQGRRQ